MVHIAVVYNCTCSSTTYHFHKLEPDHILFRGNKQGVSQALNLNVIFPIHLHFPIRSRCVFKAIIQKKKKNSRLFYYYLRKFFSLWKDAFHDNVHACTFWLIFSLSFMFLYLPCIYYFCHITFYTCGSFSIFVRDFPFSSFPLIF